MRTDVRRWTCDRCGVNDEVQLEQQGDHLVPKEWREVRIAALATLVEVESTSHLCPQCVKEFEQWMHPSVILPDPDEIGMSISQATEVILAEGAQPESGYEGRRRKESSVSPFVEGLMAKNQQGRWEVVSSEDEQVLADGFVSQEAAAAWWHEIVERDEGAPRNVTYRERAEERT